MQSTKSSIIEHNNIIIVREPFRIDNINGDCFLRHRIQQNRVSKPQLNNCCISIILMNYFFTYNNIYLRNIIIISEYLIRHTTYYYNIIIYCRRPQSFFFLFTHLVLVVNTRYTITAIRVYVTPSNHRCPCGSGKVPKYLATNSARGCDDEFRLKYTCVFLSAVLQFHDCITRALFDA